MQSVSTNPIASLVDEEWTCPTVGGPNGELFPTSESEERMVSAALMSVSRRGLRLRSSRSTLLLGLSLLLSAVAVTAFGFFLDHHPKIRGDSYSYTGEGDRPDADGFFFPGDVYTDV